MSLLFTTYRKAAMEKVQKDKHRVARSELSLLETTILNWEHPERTKIFFQIARDLIQYPFYDALAMWMDDRTGLAKYYPKEMEEIGKLFLQD